MTTLTRAQVALYAASAGLPDLFADIAMAESSGRTDVVNSIGCVGLWQINQPVHVKSHPTWTVGWLKNPGNNARAAKVLYDASGYSPWAASRSKWQPSESTSPISGAVDTVQGIAEASTTGARALIAAGKWLSTPYNWLRIAEVTGGGIAILVGINAMTSVPKNVIKKVAKLR